MGVQGHGERREGAREEGMPTGLDNGQRGQGGGGKTIPDEDVGTARLTD